MSTSSSFSFGAQLKSNLIHKQPRQETIKECSLEADTGILDAQATGSCENDQTCIKSESSSLGGICVTAGASTSQQQRKLDDGQQPDYDQFDYFCQTGVYQEDFICDCSGADAATKGGVISCDYASVSSVMIVMSVLLKSPSSHSIFFLLYFQ